MYKKKHQNIKTLLGVITLTSFLSFSGTASAFHANALPTKGKITYGKGNISTSGRKMTVKQYTPKMIANWKTFNIGANANVTFRQPNSDAVALNRISDQNPSLILGSLRANGNIYLINPAGIVFGEGAQVNVGGLIASSLKMRDKDFVTGRYTFTNNGNAGSVINQGNINAGNGGVVALIGPRVINEGNINAEDGDVLLAAGKQVTLDLNEDGLIGYTINKGAVDAWVENSGYIQADGGMVVLSAEAKNDLTSAVVNNSGIIEAHTLDNKSGRILLLSDMDTGTTIVGGTLDASAPDGGDGGFIETSGKSVKITDGAFITTLAPKGKTGTFQIDPYDFTIATSGGDVTGSAITTALASNNVTIQTTDTGVTCTGVSCGSGTNNNGDIFVNDNITWTQNTLTLNAWRNIEINSELFGSETSQLALLYGQGAVASGNTATYEVNAPVDLPAGNNFSTKLGSDGATINYYVITDLGVAADATSGTNQTLQGMARTGNLSGYYALGSNIDATDTSSWNGGLGFAPVGNSTNKFNGKFDGLGHTISNLYINRPTQSYVGLFGYTGSGSSVSNVGLVGGSVSGWMFVGGLVGLSYGAITNSYATGSVSGTIYYIGGLVGRNYSAITNSYATGSVTGSGSGIYIGGLVGWNENGGTITNAYATGSVSGTNNDVGGLVGINYGAITNSYATGSVTGVSNHVGGLVGTNAGTITNSYATGSVTGSGSGTYCIGGLVGSNSGTLSNSHYDIDNVTINGGHYVTEGGIYHNQYTDWFADKALNITDYFSQVDGYYTINNTNDLKNLLGFADNPAYSFRLTNNLDLSALPDLYVPFFAGMTFDGNSKTISNLSVNQPFKNYNIGFIGRLNSGSSLTNLNLTGVSVTGYADIGGLAGINSGSITNSYSSGSVSGTSNYVGGLVGYNSGTISSSYATDSVSGNNYAGGFAGFNSGTISNSYATGSVSGSGYLGGLVGYNYHGTITNAYAMGSVSGTNNYVGGLVGYNYHGTITNAYATGKVNNGVSGQYTGGLVGYNSGTVTNSFWDIITTAQSTSAGGTGMTTSQMMTQAYFETGSIFITGTGWDFTNTWWLSEGNTRPFLRMEYSTNIINAHQLQLMAMNPGANYTLGADINMAELTNPSGMWGAYYGFVPVGKVGTQFTGAFNGQNHTITNFTINRSYLDYVGLFGYIGSGGIVSNVGLDSGSVTGGNNTGGLVGYNKGTISESYSGVSVTGKYEVGGLAGWNDGGAIEKSYAIGAVSGTGGDVGGLLGGNYLGAAENVYATGSVTGKYAVGGLIGFNYGDISNAYATGSVNGTCDVGGLIGSNYDTVLASFWDTTTSGTFIGIGAGTQTGATGKDTAGMQTASTYTDAGWDAVNIWNFEVNSYPTLKN